VDAAPVIAAADPADRHCKEVRALLMSEPRLIVPAPVSAEIDYLLRKRSGPTAARAFLDDVARELIEVVGLTPAEHASARQIDQQYDGLRLGLADASVIVLAKRFATSRLLTFDERHFRAVRSLSGEPFTLLPFDPDS
jgi:uncharacterized protein